MVPVYNVYVCTIPDDVLPGRTNMLRENHHEIILRHHIHLGSQCNLFRGEINGGREVYTGCKVVQDVAQSSRCANKWVSLPNQRLREHSGRGE